MAIKDKYEIVDNFHYDEENHFWCIDAYEWGHEEGHVVAVVHDSGDVWYIDNGARSSEKVRQAILDVKGEIRKRFIDKRCPEGSVELWCQIGGHIFATKEELDKLLGEYEKGQDDLMEKIVKRSFLPEGRCTIPSFTVEELAEEHELDYPDGDYEFAVHLA